MGFRSVPTLVTLNDFERRNGPYFALFTEFSSFGGVAEDKPILSVTKCSPKNLVLAYMTYGDIRRGHRERVHYREAPSHNRRVINLRCGV